MFDRLKNHPFAVEAYFNKSLVITLSVPKEELIRLIPPCLELDLFNEQWAFLAVAVVQTTSLRPKGFPKFIGRDFILTGYRIFTRFTTPKGRRLRGLYIIRSETDQRRMETLGSIFTRYRYGTTDISFKQDESHFHVQSIASGLNINVVAKLEPSLPQGSPFSSWKEARRFAGPLPFTFSWLPEMGKVLVIEGVREDWEPTPVCIETFNSDVVNRLGCKGVSLASGFLVRDVSYYWKKGKLMPWNKEEN